MFLGYLLFGMILNLPEKNVLADQSLFIREVYGFSV